MSLSGRSPFVWCELCEGGGNETPLIGCDGGVWWNVFTYQASGLICKCGALKRLRGEIRFIVGSSQSVFSFMRSTIVSSERASCKPPVAFDGLNPQRRPSLWRTCMFYRLIWQLCFGLPSFFSAHRSRQLLYLQELNENTRTYLIVSVLLTYSR